jgi:hypothetical protein
MMEKIKFHELVQDVAAEALKESIGVAKPKYKDKSDKELAEAMGLSEYQYNHFMDKALGRAFAQKIESKMLELLKDKKSIEVPHAFNIFLHESKARVNENGDPARKLSIRTRTALKNELNQ